MSRDGEFFLDGRVHVLRLSSLPYPRGYHPTSSLYAAGGARKASTPPREGRAVS